MKTALIFGVTGQDGSHLADLLLGKGYLVIGVTRRVSTPNYANIHHLLGHERFELFHGDVADPGSVARAIKYVDGRNIVNSGGRSRVEVYNLAAQSHVGVSFDEPSHTGEVVYGGTLNILEALRSRGHEPFRFYQASSSEMYGSSLGLLMGSVPPEAKSPNEKGNAFYIQSEETPFAPNSPYAVAKLAAHQLVNVYRKSYGLHASCGILFNHEGERRGEQFVTRKITKYVASLWVAREKGVDIKPLLLGNIDASRDWGYAGDYVRAMWLMLQQDKPDDYVVATGKTHTVRQFLAAAFMAAGFDEWEQHVRVSPKLLRPCEVPYLRGDASKARRQLGWEPEVDLAQLARRMVLADIEKAKREYK